MRERGGLNLSWFGQREALDRERTQRWSAMLDARADNSRLGRLGVSCTPSREPHPLLHEVSDHGIRFLHALFRAGEEDCPGDVGDVGRRFRRELTSRCSMHSRASPLWFQADLWIPPSVLVARIVASRAAELHRHWHLGS